MSRILTIAAIAVTLSLPAYAHIMPNGDTLQGLSPNGIMPNGISPNGVSNNTAIGSSTLVGVELPR
jgi:hypothetical protein